MSRLRLFVACLLLVVAPSILLAACGDDSGPPGTVSVRAVFELAGDPIDFGAVPFPDDLYLRDGHVELGAFPREERADPATIASLRGSLHEIDGFGVSSPVFFYFDGALDPASLPADARASLLEDASVFLVDADPASPTASERVPVVARWDATEQRLSLQPLDGHPLIEGTRYAAVVTTRVRSSEGAAIEAAEQFAIIRDATARPTDALEAEAYDQYAPVIASLAMAGTPREEIVALAVFTVQTVADDLVDARDVVRGGDAPAIQIERAVTGEAVDALLGAPSAPLPGGDVPGGVAHDAIGWVIDGTFESPELASPAPGQHGRWTRDASGALVVKRTDRVWFTLVLPSGVDLATMSVPVVVFQHGLGGQRGNAFAVANTLCAAGFAVAAIDIPYHGMRTTGGAIDARHAYGASEGADLYGDLGGQAVYVDFLGIGDDAGELVPFHPFYTRDVFRQSVVDLMGLVRVLREGVAEAVATAGGPAFTVASAPFGFVGVSLGGILGTVFVANEPEIGASVLAVTGGHLARLVEMSPSFAPTFLSILLPRYGYSLDAIDWQTETVSSLPGIAIFQTLLDRGDSMAHAAVLARRPVHVLMHMAHGDETVPNVATESLARVVGAPIVGAPPAFTDLDVGMLPVSQNVMIGDTDVTRVLVTYEDANHGLLTSRSDAQRWMQPALPPFVAQSPPIELENPIDDAQAQMRHFFATWREGRPEVAPAE
ncbi:hypothetical protein [Sandaracinus amylolyticus]|uniref:hypothetical protein n=1 Tax=Sandaracinus amylolyticus TaxID=927083 RepID=UPI0009F9375A|nr:hypothetical protein [Sandaracinus amylolyticus]